MGNHDEWLHHIGDVLRRTRFGGGHGAVVTLAAVLALSPAPAHAGSIIKHLGSADPVTEGWTLNGDGVGIAEGPVFNDLGSGLDAWKINDPTTATGSTRFYTFVPSPTDIATAVDSGWTLTARLRVVNALEHVDRAIAVEFIDGATRWRMDFGSDSDGDPIVMLQTGNAPGVGGDDTGITFTVEGGGGGYHLYELRFDPASHTADLFIDGVRRISGFGGMADSLTRVTFGAGQAGRTGHANYNLVNFEVAAPRVVGIDIKPGEFPNSINLDHVRFVPVAILSTAVFDATVCDPDSISLAGARVRLIGRGNRYQCGIEDVNLDGFPDLVCHVETVDWLVQAGDTDAQLVGTCAGESITGEDSIRIVPPE